jgi:hypothetical protein
MKASHDSPEIQTRKLGDVVYISFVQDQDEGDDDEPSNLDEKVPQSSPRGGLITRAASSPRIFVRRMLRSDSSKDSPDPTGASPSSPRNFANRMLRSDSKESSDSSTAAATTATSSASSSPRIFMRRMARSVSKDSTFSSDKELLSIKMDSVLEVFAEPKMLKKLIGVLELADLELSYKVKLVAAVMDMCQAEGTPTGKRARGREITNTFAKPGGQFFISNIPFDIEKSLLEKEDFGGLEELKAVYLEEIIKDKLALSTVFRLCTEDW